jgi:alpha-amylase
VKTIHELVRAKMNGLERYLIYDRSPRSSLLDRIFLKEATLANVLAGKNVERVSPATLTYAHEIQKKGREASVTLSWEGAEWRLWKEIGLGPGREMIPVYLLVENVSQKRIQAKYGIEFNLALLAGDAPDRYFQLADRELPDKKFASTGEEMDVGVVRAVNRWEGWAMEIQASPKATLWRYPVQTVQNSEAGFELVYQASCLIFLWDLDLGPGESFTAWLSIGVARLGDE